MLNLLDLCSLDITFDTEANELLYSDSVTAVDHHVISLQELLPTLLNKSLTYPVSVYEEYHKVCNACDESLFDSGINYDIIIIPAGLLGIEYSKTHIYFSPINQHESGVKYSSIIEVQYGVLTLLIQQNRPNCGLEFDSQIEQGFLARIRPGEKFTIPRGCFYTFMNTGDSPAIFTRVYKDYNILDYSLIKKERGLGYYCIRKNGRQELVYNPLYKNTPRILEINADHFGSDVKKGLDHSLYQSVKSELDFFVELLST